MSRSQPPRARPAGTGTTTTDEPAPEDLLALLDADYTQSILAAIRSDAKPARTLAEECGASRPTVYRRLNRLEDAGIVESEIAYDADGPHRTVFRATLDSLTVDLGENLAVTVSRTGPECPEARGPSPEAAD